MGAKNTKIDENFVDFDLDNKPVYFDDINKMFDEYRVPEDKREFLRCVVATGLGCVKHNFEIGRLGRTAMSDYDCLHFMGAYIVKNSGPVDQFAYLAKCQKLLDKQRQQQQREILRCEEELAELQAFVEESARICENYDSTKPRDPLAFKNAAH